MHLNESPFPPSSRVVSAIAEAARQINRYPPIDSAELLGAIAKYCGAPADRIVLSSGSNELLHLLPLIARAGGGEMIVPDPSFPTFRKVAGFHDIAIRAVPVTQDGRADVDAILSATTPRCRLVCVPSPNNPTGGMLSADEITRLAEGVPATMLLHFDEAYYEFGRQAGGVETLPILSERTGPWIASRSFSKAFGLAGLRLGYSIASSCELAARCRSLRPNFCVNALAQIAGKAALDDLAAMHETVEKIAVERERLRRGLTKSGFSPLPSAANFVALPLASSTAGLAGHLAASGILVGSFDLPGGAPAIRITTGAGDDTDALLLALGSYREP